MKFVKGMITGMVIAAGAAMLCTECMAGPNKMVKQGKKVMKKMGLI